LLLRTELGLAGRQFLVSASLIDVDQARVVSVASVTLHPDALSQGGLQKLVQALVAAGQGADAANVQAASSTRASAATSASASAGTPATTREPAVPQLGRTLVSPRPAEDAGLTAEAHVAFGQRLAGVLAQAPGTSLVTDSEVAKMLATEADRQLFGAGDLQVTERLARLLEAEHVVTTQISRFGERYEVSASLLEPEGAVVLRRLSLTVQVVEHLPLAAEVLGKRLLGMAAELPPPPAPASRFEAGMRTVSRRLADAFAPLRSDVAKIAVFPFEDADAFARRQQAGSATARTLTSLLGQAWGIPVVDLDKVPGGQGAASSVEYAPRALAGGARAFVTGRVFRLGTDLMVEARLTDVLGNQTLLVTHAFIPLGDEKSLIPTEALVLRTRADALYRAVLPGWGQFYNGPRHYGKGAVVLGGTLLSLVSAGALIGLAAERTWVKAPSYERGGDAWFDDCPGVDKTPCADKRQAYLNEATQLTYGGIGALVVGAAFYGYGFIDAGLSASDYSDLME
ncbi:MAG: hypothetical protein VKI39_07635, partial [Synechococcus sp.]|nr:hypothetical protein [Synechococcus sp.]